LAVSLQRRGLKVGVIDADIYGHSIPNMMGSTDRPHQVDEMIMPLQAHGVKLISIGHFVGDNSPVVWRGPMLHRAIQQFLGDVFWGDLDILLLDLPPGTGDVAISVAQLVPNAELLIVTTPHAAAAEVAERAGSTAQQTRQRIGGGSENMSGMQMPDGSQNERWVSGGLALSVAQLVRSAELLMVTTPQAAAAEVAGRAGSIAQQTRQRIGGVIENMSWMQMPDGSKTEIFGSGGGQLVADRLSQIAGTKVPLLGQIPLDPNLRIGGDLGNPIALSEPNSEAAQAFGAIADHLALRRSSLAGKSLGLGVTRK